MRLHRTLLAAIAIGALLGAGGCSNNTQGDDASPVFLTVNFTLLPVAKNVNDGAFLQFDTVAVKSVLKVPNATSTQFLDVRLDDYVVEWSRIDGGHTASPTEQFVGNLMIPAGGSSTLTNYPFMRPDKLNLPPLDQLFPYNGGIDRETGSAMIVQRGKVTFRGHTVAGQPVSGWNAFDMNFYWAPTAARIQAVASPAKGR